MLTSKTMILWGRDDVLRRSVELLLTVQKGWKVVTITNSQNPEQLIEAIEQLNPKVVILHQGDTSVSSKGEMDLPLCLIQKHPGVQVITLSLEDNSIEVYSMQKVLIKGICDFLSVVEG